MPSLPAPGEADAQPHQAGPALYIGQAVDRNRRFTARLKGKVDVPMLTLDGAKLRKANALVASASVTLALAANAAGPVRSASAPPVPAQRAVAEVAPSAAEISKRFLAFVDGLGSRSDVSIERYQRAMGVQLKAVGKKMVYASGYLPSGASYLLVFYYPGGGITPGVSLTFAEAGVQGGLRTLCPVSLDQFGKELKALGYYETTIHGEIGQVESIRYARGDVELWVVPAVVQSKDGGSGRLTCMQKIMMLE